MYVSSPPRGSSWSRAPPCVSANSWPYAVVRPCHRVCSHAPSFASKRQYNSALPPLQKEAGKRMVCHQITRHACIRCATEAGHASFPMHTTLIMLLSYIKLTKTLHKGRIRYALLSFDSYYKAVAVYRPVHVTYTLSCLHCAGQWRRNNAGSHSENGTASHPRRGPPASTCSNPAGAIRVAARKAQQSWTV